MTIHEEIKQDMEDFLYKEISKMIENEEFTTLYDIEKIKYGDYNIKITYDHSIEFLYNGISFYLQKEIITQHKKTFFSIKYGKDIETKTLTRIGKIIELFYSEQMKYQDIKKHKESIDALPDDVKKSILRKRKFEEIIEDNDFPEDELRDGL